jgi:hypothetical protein
VCLEPVQFDPLTRLFTHLRPTACRGIDGVILDVPHREWLGGRGDGAVLLSGTHAL